MVMTSSERRFSGQYSAVSVIALGMAPPSPRPVRKRSTISMSSDVDQADTRLMRPKKKTLSSSTVRRPKRSAKGPMVSAPTMRPNSPAPKTGASWAGESCHCARMAGAMKPIAAVSKPSMATIRKHRTTIMTW